MPFRIGQHFLLVFLAVTAPLSSTRAFEVETGQCQQMLSGTARVRVHYASGLKAEVDPVGPDNVTTQVDVFQDGRTAAHKWIGGLLPLESPGGRFVYADMGATKRLQFEPGETRQFPLTFHSTHGTASFGTMEVAVKDVKKAALGECDATFVSIMITMRWDNSPQPAKISRLFLKEIGFFVASSVERLKDGKPELVEFRATRLELMR
jgi:hypothetical protein